jgi:hypothetical protein
MKAVTVSAVGNDKLLHVEADGCVIHITVGLHDTSGERYTSVEVTPAHPDGNGDIWVAEGATSMLVRCRGPQVLVGDILREDVVEGVMASNDRVLP